MRVISVVLIAIATACTSAPSGAPGTPDDSGYTSTRYPIVLMSGLIGWNRLFGVQEYFNGIPEALEADGARVYVVTANQGGAIPERAAEIVPQLRNILAETGAEKLNLIGHSFGGLDARYIAATEPGIIASVTAVSSPNRGTEV